MAMENQKTILFVCRVGESVNEIKYWLEDNFQIQLCYGNLEIMDGMLRIVTPDLIIIDLEEFAADAREIFELLSDVYRQIPVITLANSEQYDPFVSFYLTKQFENLAPDAPKEKLLSKCMEKTGISKKETPVVDLSELNFGNKTQVKKRILIVDDSAIWLRNMKSWLQSNYEVTIAISGAQALTSIGREIPDVILLDYEMPVINGRQVFEILQSDPDLRKIPVIFLTGVSDKNHIEEVLYMKPAAYLLKPIDQAKLLTAIQTVINGHRFN